MWHEVATEVCSMVQVRENDTTGSASFATGTRSRAMLEELRKYVLADPRPFVIDLEQSEGMWLATEDGQRLFDWVGYYGAKMIAHNHPRLYEERYTKRLIRAANNKTANPDFLTKECLEYYRVLREIAPRCMVNQELEVYVVNSGAEAVENVMKYFINLHHEKLLKKGRLPGVRRFVYFDQAFHGRTVFALNVTQMSHDPLVTRDFHGFAPGNIQVPFPAIDNDRSSDENINRTQHSLTMLEDVLKRCGDEIVGIIVEPMQGAGGQRVASAEFFRELSTLAHEYQVSLGFDEVQTAGGTTGDFFAIDAFELPHSPQAVACGKKLGNGVVYMQKPMTDQGVLDSTWGGTLSDMVRFVQELTIVRDERLIEAVPAKAKALCYVLSQLQQEFPELIANIRGLGLYQGFSLREPKHKAQLIDFALKNESTLLLGAGRDAIRLRPHLHVTEQDIHQLYTILQRCLCLIER
jgi:L-lysine 6-transaminase